MRVSLRSRVKHLDDRVAELESHAAAAAAAAVPDAKVPRAVRPRDVVSVYVAALVIIGLISFVCFSVAQRNSHVNKELWDLAVIWPLFLAIVAYLQFCESVLTIWRGTGKQTIFASVVWAVTWVLALVGSVGLVIDALLV